jgi:hypothetical protein
MIVIDPATDAVSYINGLPAGKYVGGSLGPDGKIYCTPNRPGPILVIDPDSQKAAPMPGLMATDHYWGSVLTPHGSIIAIPWDARKVLMIDFGVKVPPNWALSRLYNRF